MNINSDLKSLLTVLADECMHNKPNQHANTSLASQLLIKRIVCMTDGMFLLK